MKKIKELRTYQVVGINGKLRAESFFSLEMKKFSNFEIVLDGNFVTISDGENVTHVPLTNVCYFKLEDVEEPKKTKKSVFKSK